MNSVKVPKYRHHKASGQAVVTIQGRDHYLGPHGSHESIERYARLVAEAQLNGGVIAPKQEVKPTVNAMLDAYEVFCEHYYGKTPDYIRVATKHLRLLAGNKPLADYKPLDLLTLQQHLVSGGRLRRSTINSVVGIVKRAFKWAVSRDMVEPAVWQALTAVEGLRRGRTAAQEPRKVLPVDEETVEATLPFLTRPVRGLVRLLLATGARPGELVGLRAVDLDTSGPVWCHRPAEHKTALHGHERVIWFGPRAQEVLREFMARRPVNEPLFSPQDHLEERSELATVHRRPNQAPNPKVSDRVVGNQYDSGDIRRAVERAVAAANRDRAERLGRPLSPEEEVPKWFPYQLRHTFATRVRSEFDIEASRVALGHRDAGITLTYAEADARLAATVAARLG
ncbi:MAG TPA: tyrosine-type recombinase/integrase [Candidatus Hydrogenedentes bacterium]|nr:tyrosine-type recombinase/integrase [Candidatus Hydrogenedentota bacterium]